MKKLTNIASPFILLLLPLFLLIGVLALNGNPEIPAAKQGASVKLKMPALKAIIQAVLK